MIREMLIFYALLPYVCFPFLPWVKFCSEGKVFFIWETKKRVLVALGRWSSYAVAIIWEFAWEDSALTILDKWLS